MTILLSGLFLAFGISAWMIFLLAYIAGIAKDVEEIRDWIYEDEEESDND